MRRRKGDNILKEIRVSFLEAVKGAAFCIYFMMQKLHLTKNLPAQLVRVINVNQALLQHDVWRVEGLAQQFIDVEEW
jgi:hypothetical protein